MTLEVVMGAHGPIPKRSEERRRRNKDDGPEVLQAPSGAPAELPDLPEPDPNWHPIATDWYVSLQQSGQAQFYEPSDWAVARYAAELMSRGLSSDRAPNGQYVAALNSVMTSLLTTEGDRRRARIELERKKPAQQAPASVTAIADYRASIGG
ncbi:phage terminase small subunit [Streptomyces sp. GESEQ-13]|uniref:phage terminase small subunit n=1 Tax=Streptomyces sp. GESEQ-13 TaxID=2812654 RepID=UPI001FF0BAE4